VPDVTDDEPTAGGDEPTAGGDEPTAGGDEPMADLARQIAGRKEGEAESVDDVFTAVDVGAVDRDELWADLRNDDEPERITVASSETDEGRDVRTIDKGTCHGCPHLGDPPELHCTHEGTEILSVVDTGRFRVADCPVVVEEADLGFDAGESEHGVDAED
jgi:hypothetical protein